jgi:nucleoid-associated protein YgaU
MKPSTLVALLVVILIAGVAFILWISGAFEPAAPPPPILEPEPITSTLIGAEPFTATGFGGISLTPTLIAEPTVSHYTIQPGDTLWKIAKKFYNDGAKHKLIADANKDKIPNPNKLKVGTEIVIPDAGVTSPSSMNEPSGIGIAGEDVKYYTVKKGDTLSSISKKFYGTVNKRNAIVEANRDKLATEGTTLKIGWKLLIPNESSSKASSRSGGTSLPPPMVDPKIPDNQPSGAPEEGPK